MTVLMNRATVAVVCRLTVVVAFALSFALSLALAPAARAQQPAEVYTILVMGDSLSAEYGLRRDTGWIKLLERDLNQPANKLNRRIEIFNASISGETTSGGAHRLPEQLSLHHPDLVIIELGANDALRGLAIQATQDNLRNMVKQSQATRAQVLILGMQIPPNYGRDYTQKFKQLFHDVAIETGSSEVPFFLEAIAAQRDMFQADGLHPVEVAQPLLMQTVKATLLPLIVSARPVRQK